MTYAVVQFILKSIEKISIVPTCWIRNVDGEMFVCWPGWVGRELTAALKDAVSPEENWPKYKCSIILGKIGK